MKKLIEQIGRERLENIAQFHRSMSLPPSHDEIECMARALLSVLDAKDYRTQFKGVGADQMHRVCLEANRHLDKYKAMAEEVNKLIRRGPLYTTPPAASAPDGYRLVPVEPTWDMLSADGCKEHPEGKKCLHHDNRRRIWAAMLAAAPAPGQ